MATATASEDRGFDPSNVIRLEVFFLSSGALDNLEICQPSQAPVPIPTGRRVRFPIPAGSKRR